MSRSSRRWLIVWLVLWFLAGLAYVVVLAAGHRLGDLACEDPTGSSNYGHASWQWWAPGIRCAYDSADLGAYGVVGAHVDRPTAIAPVALIAGPLVGVAVARGATRRRRGLRSLDSKG
jgi:hypothetical protein